MREILEEVGSGQHPDRPPLARDHDRIRASRQPREDLVERVACVDSAERRLYRVGDVFVQRVRVLEDAVEQVAVLERPDHVGERVDLAVAYDGELRDRVLLHRVDRLADLLVRGDGDERRHAGLLEPLGLE